MMEVFFLNEYMALVASKYVDEISFTSNDNSYRGRYANLEIRPDSGHIGDVISICPIPEICGELKQFEETTLGGRILVWSRICRAIFIWGLKDPINMVRSIHEAENVVKSGQFDPKKIEKRSSRNEKAHIKIKSAYASPDDVQRIKREFTSMMKMTQASDGGVRQYSKTYLVNMIFAAFIDAGKPVEDLVFL